jgi:hypothetical protein
MKMLKILLSILIIVISSCEKKDTEEVVFDCEAIVLNNLSNVGITCNKEVYTLKFIKGEDKIKSIIEDDYNVTDHNYSVLNLPDDLKTIGLTLKLDIRELKSDEFPSCYNGEMPIFLGPTFYVIRAEKK